MKIKAICFRETGIPEEVAHLEERQLPELKHNQVFVTQEVACLNPADINLLEGKYGIRPEPFDSAQDRPKRRLPSIPGNEGVGVVTEVGNAVSRVRMGERVIAPGRIGSWCEGFVAEEESLVVVPREIPVEQATLLSINAPTAFRLLNDFVSLKPGDWIIQNAANSAVGRFVVQIAHELGLKTVSVVRRKELIPELKSLGADVVVTDETPLSKQIKELTKGASILLGLNAVGGDSAREIAKSLSPHGTLVTYGAMGREPLQISNALLIFKDLRFRGLWINEWFRLSSLDKIQDMYSKLIPWMKEGRLRAPIEKAYRLEDYKEAIKRAQEGGRKGKILFQIA